MKNENNLEKQVESKKFRITARILTTLATAGLTYYFLHKELFPPNDPPFADISIIPITEMSLKETLKNPLEKFYPSIEKYDQMSIEEFEKQPLKDRLMFADYLIQKTEKQGVYKKYYNDPTLIDYSFKTGLAPVNPEYSGMTDFQAVNNYVHIRQLALLQFKNNHDGEQELDKINCKKILSAAFYNNSSYTQPKYNEIKEDIDLLTKPGLAKVRYDVIKSTDIMVGDREVNGQNEQIKYKEVYFYDHVEYKNYYARFVLENFTSYDGSQKFIWLLDDMSPKHDGYSLE